MSRRPPPAPQPPPGPAFRSGAVARMAQMPVATLRIWEQRYGAVKPATAASGHRLYGPGDVERVLLLRRLTEAGHAIGSIAGLDTAALEELAHARAPAHAAPAPRTRGPAAGKPLRLAVIGPALALRLQRPALAPGAPAGSAPQVIAVFDSPAAAARAAAGVRADVLLWSAPELPAPVLPDLAAARRAWGARHVAVVYRFGDAAAARALAAAGIEALREPADDVAWAAWLASRAAGRGLLAAAPKPARRSAAARDAGAIAPRRYDDAALTAIAGLAPTLACECPRHVAELLMELASFERYSAQCASRSTADAELHAWLQRTAGTARLLFEDALERVARHEGVSLG